MVFQTDINQSTQLVPHVAAEQTLDLVGYSGYFDRYHCFEDWSSTARHGNIVAMMAVASFCRVIYKNDASNKV